ncbi:hypothetical protein GCM10010129_57360 [Streptomyces fumigatiscleroticus]|nr:hypothetical protein GCM10010129_57360 [Streptomyces fumigatiscleroticus]
MKYSGTSTIRAAAVVMPARPARRLPKVSFMGSPEVRWWIPRRFAADALNAAAPDTACPWAWTPDERGPYRHLRRPTDWVNGLVALFGRLITRACEKRRSRFGETVRTAVNGTLGDE